MSRVPFLPEPDLHDTPVRPTEAEATLAYWAKMRAAEMARLADVPPPDPHEGHRGQSVYRLMSNCPECGEAKIRWMLRQPRGSHERNHGERLAARHGIAP